MVELCGELWIALLITKILPQLDRGVNPHGPITHNLPRDKLWYCYFFAKLCLKLHILHDLKKKKKYKNEAKVHIQIRIYIRAWLTCEITNSKPMVGVALEEFTTYPLVVCPKFNLSICGFIFDTLSICGSFCYYSVIHLLTHH